MKCRHNPVGIEAKPGHMRNGGPTQVFSFGKYFINCVKIVEYTSDAKSKSWQVPTLIRTI